MRFIVLCVCLAIVIVSIWQYEAFGISGYTKYGTIGVDPHLYIIEKHQEVFAKISGTITDGKNRQSVIVTITTPNDIEQTHTIITTSDGVFGFDLPLDHTWQKGDYFVSGKTDTGERIGHVVFVIRHKIVNTETEPSRQVLTPNTETEPSRQILTSNPTIELEAVTNQPKYHIGEQIIVSGKMITSDTGSSENGLAVIIMAPNGNIIHIDQPIIINGEFVSHINTSKHMWNMDGMYTAKIQYMNVIDRINFEFSTVDPLRLLNNNPPTLNSIPDQTITTQDSFKHVIKAADDDGDVLTYTLSDAPSRATINPLTKTINWIPNVNDIGTHYFTIDVSDGTNTISKTFSVTVKSLSQVPGTSSSSGSSFSLTNNNSSTTSQSNPTTSSNPSTTSQSNPTTSSNPSTTSQSNPSILSVESIVIIFLILVVLISLIVVIKKNRKGTSTRKGTSKVPPRQKAPLTAPPKRFSNRPKNFSSNNNEASTIAYYECPKCHDPDIINNPDGSARCKKCGFTS